MSRCLAFDASTEQCSVAVLTDTGVISKYSDEPRSHADKLLPMADELLAQNQLQLQELDFIACSIGPGSFTGLRIAFSIAQGLAYATGLPLLGISSLSALAHSQSTQVSLTSQAQLVLSVLDARMGELYWSAHLLNGNSISEVLAPALDKPQALIDFIENSESYIAGMNSELSSVKTSLGATNSEFSLSVVGPGAALLGLSQEFVQNNNLIVSSALYPNAVDIAQLATKTWLAGEYKEAASPQLLYLRNSVAWDKRKRIRT